MGIIIEWFETTWKILVRPLPSTFLNESKKSKNKLASAILWIEIGFIFLYSANYLLFRHPEKFVTVLGVLFIMPFVFLFYVFCMNTIYMRVFHRKTSKYDELLYSMTSIYILFMLLLVLLSAIPMIGAYANWVSFVYALILLVIAVRGITKLKVWESIVTVIVSTILGGAGFLCIPAIIGSLMTTVPKVF